MSSSSWISLTWVGVYSGPVAEVRLDEPGVRTGRRLEVEDGDVGRADLGQEVEQGGSHAGGRAGDDDALAGVAERVGHDGLLS
jgi:hypothetical protein